MPFHVPPHCQCKTGRLKSMKQYDIKRERDRLCVLTVDVFVMLLVRDSLCVGLLIRLARTEECWEL